MVNESILSGLQSALSRGASLKKAMIGFYNAGYPKQEIEEAARVVHKVISSGQISPQQEVSTTPQTQTPSQTEEPEKTQPSKVTYQQPAQQVKEPVKKPKKEKPVKKTKPQKPTQIISQYGQPQPKPEEFKISGSRDLQRTLAETLKHLKRIEHPSQIYFVDKEGKTRKPLVVQKYSDYGNGKPPKQRSKFSIILLVLFLILILGSLVAVIFFRPELVELLSNINLK